MELDVDSETDEEDAKSQVVDPTFGLGEGRVGQLMKLFNLVDHNGNGSIDSYELSVFATGFFNTLQVSILNQSLISNPSPHIPTLTLLSGTRTLFCGRRLRT